MKLDKKSMVEVLQRRSPRLASGQKSEAPRFRLLSITSAKLVLIVRKRLTNTPVLQAGSVLNLSDDRKNNVVSAQATYPCGSSAVGGRVCEQRYAAE
jgi:hypothetical protein